MKLGIPIYEGVNLLDVAGPLEMFYWAGQEGADLQTVLISADGKPVTSINGVRFDAQASFAEMPKLDVLWVPGGAVESLEAIMKDPQSPYLQYLRQIAADATWVCSVCEGALLLARAGLLDGFEATTHWYFTECLEKFPGIAKVDTTRQRYVVSRNASGNRLTGGGISSGLDESLKLISLLFGDKIAEQAQIATQYFPIPPVNGVIPESPACPVHWPNN